MYPSKILLLGDSITEAFQTDQLLKGMNITNLGVYGDSTVELIERINAGLVKEEYDRIYVLIGTNDLVRNRTNEEILKNFETIRESLSIYGREVFFTSLLPTRDLDSRPNTRITEFNHLLKEVTTKNCSHFFDLHSYFIDNDGQLKKEFTADGLHLIAPAYRFWADLLKKHIENIL